jgi:hypothetical protein
MTTQWYEIFCQVKPELGLEAKSLTSKHRGQAPAERLL